MVEVLVAMACRRKCGWCDGAGGGGGYDASRSGSSPSITVAIAISIVIATCTGRRSFTIIRAVACARTVSLAPFSGGGSEVVGAANIITAFDRVFLIVAVTFR